MGVTAIDGDRRLPDDRFITGFVVTGVNMQHEIEPGMADAATLAKKPLQIFRGKDAPALDEFGSMEYALSEDGATGLSKLVELGLAEGAELRVLHSSPGFSLTYVWFKPHYALPIHSHNSDCLYYVIAGQLHMGNETLSAGDGLFLPAETWYSYTAGEEGVEILEFRQAEKFDFKVRNGLPKMWERLAETCVKNRANWQTAVRPGRDLTSK